MYSTEEMLLTKNVTLDLLAKVINEHDPEDFFAGVYENRYLKYSMVLLYLLGLLPCFSLIFVVWYERSGLAGHYRTVLNQLSSIHLIYVSHVFA